MTHWEPCSVCHAVITMLFISVSETTVAFVLTCFTSLVWAYEGFMECKYILFCFILWLRWKQLPEILRGREFSGLAGRVGAWVNTYCMSLPPSMRFPLKC